MAATLLIRADASPEIGSGHVMRCIALAQRWRGSAVFASSKTTDAVAERIATCGFESVSLGIPSGTREDAAATVAAAERCAAQWVVLDGYGFGGEYQEQVKGAGFRVLALDDWGHSDRYSADLVVNPGLDADPEPYQTREPWTRLLLGTQYALLRSEFLAWSEWQREIPETASRVLVTLGGGFPTELGAKVLEGLRRTGLAEMDVRFVLGPTSHGSWGSPATSPPRVQWLRNAADMSESMAWADVALSAAGSTAWELAFMGLPAIALIIAENQRGGARALASAGATLNLGWHEDASADGIAGALGRLLRSPETRAAMSRRGRELVDGEGSARVVARMKAATLRMVRATAEHRALLWQWANDSKTRAASFSSKPIAWEEHVGWFDRKLADASSALYIGVDTQDTPVGHVRFDRSGAEATISIHVDPALRGEGWGSALILRACEDTMAEGGVTSIHAYVKTGNRASERSFLRAGFTAVGAASVGGQEALHLRFQGEAGQ